jgi:serine protease AprX
VLSLSGTSMAAGVTSGVVALVIDAHNKNGLHRQKPLTANLVKAILQYSAIPVSGADYLTQGAGEINAAGAIALSNAIDTSEAVGSWWLARGVTPASVIGGQTSSWAQNIVWGETVYGGEVVYRNNIAWGSNIVWGDNIVWGENVFVNAANIVWGENIIWG